MKQAAILYAFGHLGQRLKGVRTRTWVLAGFAITGVLAIMAWLAFAMLTWVWNQAPTVAESGRQAVSAAIDRVDQAAPGLKAQLEPLTSAAGLWSSNRAGNWPKRDVSGVELTGVTRYPGFVRAHYAREARRIELRYVGQGEFQAVLDHYVSQFRASGYEQEVIKASPDVEAHRFVKLSDTVDFEIRRAGSENHIEVVLVDVIN